MVMIKSYLILIALDIFFNMDYRSLQCHMAALTLHSLTGL